MGEAFLDSRMEMSAMEIHDQLILDTEFQGGTIGIHPKVQKWVKKP